jgi:hypothetical protein
MEGVAFASVDVEQGVRWSGCAWAVVSSSWSAALSGIESFQREEKVLLNIVPAAGAAGKRSVKSPVVSISASFLHQRNTAQEFGPGSHFFGVS